MEVAQLQHILSKLKKGTLATEITETIKESITYLAVKLRNFGDFSGPIGLKKRIEELRAFWKEDPEEDVSASASSASFRPKSENNGHFSRSRSSYSSENESRYRGN